MANYLVPVGVGDQKIVVPMLKQIIVKNRYLEIVIYKNSLYYET